MWPSSGSDAIDLIQLIAALIELAVGGRDFHRPVVLDVDLGAGLFDDLADHLAAGADHLADLVDGDLERLDARRVFAEFGARGGQCFRHFAKDMQSAVFGLGQSDLHDLLGNAGDLDVHLQRGHAAFGAGDLEVHVAEMVFVAEDVGENGKALVLENEPHGDAGGRPLKRHAGIHQRQRSAAHRRHRRRTVRTR